MTDFIDSIMGFDPNDLTVFNEPAKQSYNENVYKTNPANSKSEDGHYRSKIKILYNPFNVKESIVKQTTYAMKDQDGFFMVKSKLANGDKSCPLFTAWKKLHFSTEPGKKEWGDKMYDKSESQWVLVQILEDDNQPELKGHIKVMKLPKDVFEKMSAKMRPSPESKKQPVPIMDYLFGMPLIMDVKPGPDDPQAPWRKQREISYSLCEFSSDYEPIIGIDGKPLFTEDELETIENYASAKNELVKAKTEAKRQAAQATIGTLTDAIKELYKKSLDYLKEHAVDLVKECAYQEWDDNTKARVQRWIDTVAAMKDPVGGSVETTQTAPVEKTGPAQPAESSNNTTTDDPFKQMMNDGGDDLPF